MKIILNDRDTGMRFGEPRGQDRSVPPMTSIVRTNLMTRPGYTPYCGADQCFARWPRTRFDGEQFACCCGWRSTFEPEFIEKYKQANTGR